MPDFGNPFAGNDIDRQLTIDEAIRALRFSIAAEYEAVQLYEQIANAIPDPNIKALMKDIAEEEIVHAGEFLHALKRLNPKEEKFYAEGEKEAQGLMKTASSKPTGFIAKTPIKKSGFFDQIKTMFSVFDKTAQNLKSMDSEKAAHIIFKITGKYDRPTLEEKIEKTMKGSKDEEMKNLLAAGATLIDADQENRVRSKAGWVIDMIKKMKGVKANITDLMARLDLIASEIQDKDPVIAMAIDRISDQLEKYHG